MNSDTIFFCFSCEKQVCDVVDRLFVSMFDHLNKNCAKELEAINRQYPFKPLKVSKFMDSDERLLELFVVFCTPSVSSYKMFWSK